MENFQGGLFDVLVWNNSTEWMNQSNVPSTSGIVDDTSRDNLQEYNPVDIKLQTNNNSED